MSSRRLPFGLVLSLMLLALFFSARAGAGAGPADAVGTIAYSRDNEIRLVGTDGKNDRRLWQEPLEEGAKGILGLEWRPDGGALAFASGYQWLCSQYSSDIYTIRADGSQLKRLTNSPACAELQKFPKGTVKIRIENASADSIFGVYVEGAPETTVATISPGAIVDVTIPNVADLGDFFQSVTVINGKFRYLDPSVTVDVKPSQTVSASNSFVLTGHGNVYANVRGTLPTWHRNGTEIGFLFYEGFMSQISANPPLAGPDSFILAANANVVADHMDWSPISDWILYSSSQNISVVQPGASDGGIPIIDKDAYKELVFGLAWLPDESGFIFSISSGQYDPEYSNIYEYNFEANQLWPITDFQSGFVGGLSLSPDAQEIVFEYSTDVQAPPQLKIIRRDGTGLRSLGIQGAFPSWRPGTGINFTDGLYLPVAARP